MPSSNRKRQQAKYKHPEIPVRQIGTKTTTINGQQYTVRVFAPGRPCRIAPRRPPVYDDQGRRITRALAIRQWHAKKKQAEKEQRRASQGKTMLVTEDFIERHRTPRGGWTKQFFRAIGEWPARTGWKQRAIGRPIVGECQTAVRLKFPAGQ